MPAPKSAPKRKAANGYQFAKPLPLGEILQDITKKQWKLGPSIGQGGFGEIYSAKEVSSTAAQYPYVVKIEPHANGPLFVEMHFYMRNAKREDVEAFKKKHGLKSFGMPTYLGSGSHEHKGEKYRFIVMEKFGSDLWKTFLENDRIFPATTVFKIGVQILDILEYIHSKGYVHADIKGANILMGVTKETQNKQLYLVDFGLGTKFNDSDEYKPNPKKAHDGTIEYLSRDAHLGVQTRRGDLEILAYNLIQWLGCTLPWENKLTDVKTVQKLKEEHMSNIPKFVKTCFNSKPPPGPLVEFLKFLTSLKHNTNPDYKKIRKLFLSGLDSTDSLDKQFMFSTKHKSPTKRTLPKRRSNTTPSSARKTKTTKKEEMSASDEDIGSDSSPDEVVRSVDRRRRKLYCGDDSYENSLVKASNIPSAQRAQAKRKNNVAQVSSPRRKTARRQLKTESSEDEKENLTNSSNRDEESDSSPDRLVNYRSRQRKDVLNTEDSDEYTETPSGNVVVPNSSPSNIVKSKNNSTPATSPKKKTYRKRVDTESSGDEATDDESSKKIINLNRRRGRKALLSDKEAAKSKKPVKPKMSAKENLDNLNGYTEAMKEIRQKKLAKEKSKGLKRTEPVPDGMEGFTASMREVALKKMERLANKK